MPRANRYILAGAAYHLTHRCHNRSFLLRFARDRTEYRRRLRMAVREYDISVLTYCITSNHTHVLVRAKSPESISALMQKLEGEFAEYYNIRKHRSGAFWEGRYGCTMIDSGVHLWNCMKYIDLNMVRAGVMREPSEWAWCGYRELMGERRRYLVVDLPAVLKDHGGCSLETFRAHYGEGVREALQRGVLNREPAWTESIAVGSEEFVRRVEAETKNRVELAVEEASPSRWVLREEREPYGRFSWPKNGPKACFQGSNPT